MKKIMCKIKVMARPTKQGAIVKIKATPEWRNWETR